MAHFDELEQDGLMIRVEGRARGVLGLRAARTPRSSAVHFEKADRAYKGLFQIVNRESARRIAGLGRAPVNREEDLGDEGLRQAKLSYHPLEIARSST